MSSSAEFYNTENDALITTVSVVGAIPRIGSRINIRKETWTVMYITWAVDNADSAISQVLRANIYLEKV